MRMGIKYYGVRERGGRGRGVGGFIIESVVVWVEWVPQVEV